MIRIYTLLIVALTALLQPAWGSEEQTIEQDKAAEEHKLSEDITMLPGSLLDNSTWLPPEVRQELSALLSHRILGISFAELATSFTILLLTLIFRGVITHVIFRYLHKLSSRTRIKHDGLLLQALEKPVSILLLILGFFLALIILPMDEAVKKVVENLFRGTSMLIVVWGCIRVIDVVANILAEITQKRDSALHGFVPVLRKSIKVFIGIVGLLMVIDNLGYNVAGILATLGLGGAALAFASKDTVANGFGTLMIILDRPFKVGDWIIVGDKVDGDVESIGLRSTKVRTWPKTVLSIPNGVLANEYINNWSRMPKRRVKQVVGITYEATADDMEALVEDFRKILREDEGVEQQFILVNFIDFGSSSLDIMVYYFTKSVAWLEHMEVRQRINCKIMRAIKDRDLSVAFPTRTLYMDGPVASKLADVAYSSRWDGSGASGGAQQSEGRLPGDFGPQSPM